MRKLLDHLAVFPSTSSIPLELTGWEAVGKPSKGQGLMAEDIEPEKTRTNHDTHHKKTILS